jgi:hypothetical protein
MSQEKVERMRDGCERALASPSHRRLRRVVIGVALACASFTVSAGSGLAKYDPKDPAQAAEYAKALDLGTQAYVYGAPLLNMERTFETQTSVNVPDEGGDAPVNQFSHARQLADPRERTVVAPNEDTLYSIAWLDLTPHPIVVHVPEVSDRFYVIPLMSPYEEDFANIGRGASDMLAPGDYLVTAPGWHGHLPAGVARIESPYDRVWIIGRTEVKGEADLPNVHVIQDQYTLTPLNRWDKKKPYVPKPPKIVDDTVNTTTIPGSQPGEDPIAFFDALGDSLHQFPPPAADKPLLNQLATVGIGPGMHPGKPPEANHLSDATLHGLRDSVAAGKAKVNQSLVSLFLASLGPHNGWLVGRTGTYGTDYELRAVVDQIGLGALRNNVATYPYAQTDRLGQPLTTSIDPNTGQPGRYVAHLPASELPPPVDGFWSLTMYDSQQFFRPTPSDRDVLNDRSDLHYNPDGSLDIYLQRQAPTDPEQFKNWLPAPDGQFHLLIRLYGTKPDALPGLLDGSGWDPPTILPCLANGFTAAGWACASQVR